MTTIINGSSPSVTFSDGTTQSTAFTTGAVTQSSLAANVAGTGPAFWVYGNANQNITSATFTKVQLNTKGFDTSSAFDNVTNYRFQPTVAGYYQVTGNCGNYSTSTALTTAQTAIYKNGAMVFNTAITGVSGATACNSSVSGLVYLNGSSDYIELYGFVQASAGALFAANAGTTMYMTGVLVRAA